MAEGKLRETELDAMRIQSKRFKDHFEELDYQKSKEEADAKEAAAVKQGGETYEPSESKSK